MNLRKKKILASKTLNVGRERIIFVKSRLDEIKEALTKQDIRHLLKEGAIVIKEMKGRKKTYKKIKNRSAGKIRKRTRNRKKEYVILTRKLRGYLKQMKVGGKISKEQITGLRKRIRNKEFKSKSHLKENLGAFS